MAATRWGFMGYKWWFVGTLVLWIVTIAAVAYLFVKGWTAKEGLDSRTSVVLTKAERDQVLAEMRQLLKSVHGVLDGLVAQDLNRAGQAARAAGMAMAADVNPLLMAKLPLAFKAMGMSVHRDFDGLADGIQSGEQGDQVMKRLSDLTSRCTVCHDLYRFMATP